jgi:hypothetical protein
MAALIAFLLECALVRSDSAGGLVLLSGGKLGPQISCRSYLQKPNFAVHVGQRVAWVLRKFNGPIVMPKMVFV